ncbi:putative GTP-binding protein 6 isoform X3 [Hypanus sabinus]|uniref:putative GTP-binding protein 6 isoform X3 n=1 Tax=Hypanus sabinus TaxID=79690 RepID=UPI0028C3AADA|nr:putative GTP-binding protein 6 isoform X3 [Hypanus sabinus]
MGLLRNISKMPLPHLLNRLYSLKLCSTLTCRRISDLLFYQPKLVLMNKNVPINLLKNLCPRNLSWNSARCFATSQSNSKSMKDTCSRKSRTEKQGGGDDEVITELDCEIEESEYEELLQGQAFAPSEGGHRVFVVHPNVKWGAKKQHLTTGELQMAEAVALVNTLPNWQVVDKLILSTKSPDNKLVFGKGNFETLTEIIKGMPQITAVFMNVERLSAISEKELESTWGVKVFDRYSIVLHIFHCNARTKEAKLQIALAEIPYLRSQLRNELAHLDQQGGGSRYIMGSGKTTLIKSLTGDLRLHPRDQLFATLDVTTHAGLTPSRMTILYVDTIGFLSQLPHNLIGSFSATLEDVAHSDIIVHVRDISHPETTNQKVNVLNVLKNLQLSNQLLDSIIEVHNKIDLVDSYQQTDPNAIAVSALHGHGIDELKRKIEEAVLQATGKLILTIKVNLAGPQLSWLYKEATVQEVDVLPEDGLANVTVIISHSAYGKYRKQFQH